MRRLPGSTPTRRWHGIRATQMLARLLLRIMNVRCRLENPAGRKFAGSERYLILPNHISYLDAVLVCAYMPAVFVTSREIEESSVLGPLTRAAGCAFVERRHKGDVLRDVDQLTGLLNAGLNVTLFAEGSTSSGASLLDFKKTLLEAAVRSRCKVLPVAIRYEAINDCAFDASNCDAVAWYGDMTFFPHLLRLLATRSVDVRLSVLEAVPFRHHGSRKQLASDVKAKISQRYHADY